MPQKIDIRAAVIEDIPSIARIYNYAIENTTATFDTEPKTISDRLGWFDMHSQNYPLIVADMSGDVVGWAEIKPYGTRKAYKHTVEDAVYVDCEYNGKGIGSALLRELLTRSVDRGYHTMLALIVGGNEASLGLHYKFGFEQVGIMHEVGWKFDRWLDIHVLQKML